MLEKTLIERLGKKKKSFKETFHYFAVYFFSSKLMKMCRWKLLFFPYTLHSDIFRWFLMPTLKTETNMVINNTAVFGSALAFPYKAPWF